MRVLQVCALLLYAIACGGPLPCYVHSGTIRHDVPDASYLALASNFASVGILGNGCSATLVGRQWVLTAAHCADGVAPAPSTFDLSDGGGSVHSIEEIIVHPNWNGAPNNGYDLAVLKLATQETTVSRAILNSSTTEVDKQGVLVGYGRSGTGLTGDILPNGTKRAGMNVIDLEGPGLSPFQNYTSQTLITDFDKPGDPSESTYGSAVPLDLEYQGAPGDSGGGLFIDFGSGYLLSGVFSVRGWNDGPLGIGNDSDYGDFSGITRVSTFVPWIISIVPEPSTILLAALCSVGLLVRKRVPIH